jgi:hypothetical protein
MTIADIESKYSRWIPKSWIANESIGGGGRAQQYNNRDRDRERELDLDDTRSFRNRRYDDGPPLAPKVQVPFGVIVTILIYLIGQLVGGVWWAATLQSNLQHEMADRIKEEGRLWESIQTYRVEVQALRIDLARLSSSVTKHHNVSE